MTHSWLPGLLREIADITSLDVALRIAEVKGGQRVDIPANPEPDGWLVRAVGLEAAKTICSHFGTINADGRPQGVRHVVIPLGPSGTLSRARQKLAAEIAKGVSPREAARRVGLHERTAWRTRRRMRAGGGDDGPQGSLF